MNELDHPAARDPQASSASRDLSSLLEALRASAAERDRQGGHAAQEKQWIAEAGLLTVAVPREFGGAGAAWPKVYETIRSIARVDSALAQLLGFQCLQVVSVDVWGNPAQRVRYLRGTVEGRWWWGNAVNPLDTRLVASATADGGFRLDGQKGFCSGTRGSQMMTVSAHDPQTGKPIFAVVPTTRDGITVNEDWDPIGQRQTDSGSVSFANVKVEPEEVLPADMDVRVKELCAALAEAERGGHAFIALKWFRDNELTTHGYAWAESVARRQAVLAKAFEVGAIQTTPIPNPKSPQHPTTTVKLNRESKYAQAVAPRFQPIKLRGEGPTASEILLRDRERF